VERFGTRHSLPDWLAQRLLDEHGDAAEALAQALDAPAPRTLRANTLRVGSREELAAELLADGVATRPTAYAPHGLTVDGDAPLFRLAAYDAGRFEQQDEASQLCALLVAPPPGGRVLDACAGSGGKTLAIAAMLGNKGEILAADTHAGRLHALSARCRRAGASNVRARLVGDEWGAEVDAFAARADRILLDVPCSGIGALRRRPEARWRLDSAALAAMAATQAALLDRAAARLRPGARIVYATCTVFAAENEAPVAAALARHPELEQVPCKEILGGVLGKAIGDANGAVLRLRPDRHGTDGFFAAVLRRRR
jgi:16S rRNA (cytosine967-C5)-methyltransferase